MTDLPTPAETVPPAPPLTTIQKRQHTVWKCLSPIIKPTWGKLVMLLVGGSAALAGVPPAHIPIALLALSVLLLVLLVWTERRQLLDLTRHLIDSADEVHIKNGDFQFDFKSRPKLEIPINARSRDDPN